MNDQKFRKKFGYLLQCERERIGYTREQFSKLLDINKKTLQNWEVGRTFPEKLVQLFIKKGIKIQISELIEKASGD